MTLAMLRETGVRPHYLPVVCRMCWRSKIPDPGYYAQTWKCDCGAKSKVWDRNDILNSALALQIASNLCARRINLRSNRQSYVVRLMELGATTAGGRVVDSLDPEADGFTLGGAIGRACVDTGARQIVATTWLAAALGVEIGWHGAQVDVDQGPQAVVKNVDWDLLFDACLSLGPPKIKPRSMHRRAGWLALASSIALSEAEACQ